MGQRHQRLPSSRRRPPGAAAVGLVVAVAADGARRAFSAATRAVPAFRACWWRGRWPDPNPGSDRAGPPPALDAGLPKLARRQLRRLVVLPVRGKAAMGACGRPAVGWPGVSFRSEYVLAAIPLYSETNRYNILLFVLCEMEFTR